MVVNEMRRDNRGIAQNENFTVVLDTFYDRRNGFIFQTNPLGALADGLITDERNNNTDWNTVWDVKTKRFDQGWTVEMVIPFKSLRYNRGRQQIWGINLRREIRWKNEETYLSPIPASYSFRGLMKMSSAATLVGVEVPAALTNLEFKPYAISSVTTNKNADPAFSNDLGGDIGFDGKYGLTEGLTADFTVNTDFAQVEDDEAQVNLTRFSLFFPEKREFFLEGQGLFAFGGAGTRRFGGGGFGGGGLTPIMFFSRSIGLDSSIRGGGARHRPCWQVHDGPAQHPDGREPGRPERSGPGHEFLRRPAATGHPAPEHYRDPRHEPLGRPRRHGIESDVRR